MAWYQWLALAALVFCLASCLFHFLRLVRLGRPVDYSQAAGNASMGVKYAFTYAMNPRKKESAYLHLPTYAAGLFYHSGTFLCVILFFLNISGLMPPAWLAMIISAFLCIAVFSGTGILIKRIINKELRSLSNPDDYISNILVTLFQLFTLFMIILPILQSSNRPIVQSSYYLIFTLLMLYLPLGKLRHVVYFFAARYHLGFFYGRRGIWPPTYNKVEDSKKLEGFS